VDFKLFAGAFYGDCLAEEILGADCPRSLQYIYPGSSGIDKAL